MICQAAQHNPLRGLDRWRDAAQGSSSGVCQGQFASSPIPAAGLALHQSFEDQPVRHSSDGRTIKGNQAGKRDLIDPGIGADGGERRVLDRREIVTGRLNLGQEHSNRNLLEATCQVSRHFIGWIHRTLPQAG